MTQNLDVSYIEPDLPRATWGQALRHYLASAGVYGAVLVIFTVIPWFRELLSIRICGDPAMHWYRLAYVVYLLIAPLVFFIGRPRSLWVSKNLRIVGYLGRVFRWRFQHASLRSPDAWRPTYEEKHAIAFLLIKSFYGPLMIHSGMMDYYGINQFLRQAPSPHALLDYADRYYVLFAKGIFLVDSFLFAVGYHNECGPMRNKLRYAETNPWHILICVACYPPFNNVTSMFIGPSNGDPYILFGGDIHHPLTWILRGLAVLFLVLLASSSWSLFTKASNLTNRGIVDWGSYRFIRHPGYLGKNLYWIMTLIPTLVPNTTFPGFTWTRYALFFGGTVLGIVCWATVYFLRAITEERFLMRDPDYVAYCKKVRYRFIPGVY
jgi:protein-S-isoprenylcysteine O-methyltransferase Ste14